MMNIDEYYTDDLPLPYRWMPRRTLLDWRTQNAALGGNQQKCPMKTGVHHNHLATWENQPENNMQSSNV